MRRMMFFPLALGMSAVAMPVSAQEVMKEPVQDALRLGDVFGDVPHVDTGPQLIVAPADFPMNLIISSANSRIIEVHEDGTVLINWSETERFAADETSKQTIQGVFARALLAVRDKTWKEMK